MSDAEARQLRVVIADDDTFTLTQSTNSHVGKAVRFVATGTVIVEFNAHNPPPGLVTELTDSSGGTANDTVAAVEGDVACYGVIFL